MGLNSQSMAGLSKIADGSSVDSPKTVKELQSNDIWLDLGPLTNGSVKSDKNRELRCLFDRVFADFVNESCGSHCFRPLPPLLGNGKSVDLFKLYLAVRKRGGYGVVTDRFLWDVIAKENGFDAEFAASLKLIYSKYLDSLDKWMQRAVNGKDLKVGLEDSVKIRRVLMTKLDSESRGFSLGNSAQECGGKQVNLGSKESKPKSTGGKKLHKDGDIRTYMNVGGGKAIGSDRLFECTVVCEVDSGRDRVQNDEVQSSVQLNGNHRTGNDKKMADVEKCSQGKEDAYNRKRKRECSLGFIDWIKNVAKDPCDPAIGFLPQMSKWKYIADDQPWKQVLMVREARLAKRNANSSSEQSIWQKKQTLHPSMYEDNLVSETSRSSQRIVSAKISKAILSFKKSQGTPGSQSDLGSTYGKRSESRVLDPLDPTAGLWFNNYSRGKVFVGKYFQAEVPEWNEKAESDSKWLGKRVWPLEKGMSRNSLIERDRTGFGRHDQCGCEHKGSFECVRFHVSAKRAKLKLELGLAFYHWEIDNMGEEVGRSWNKIEETNFESIIRSNPQSQGMCFWDELRKFFPYRKREDLVSYYYNVFLLRRRGLQNRSTPIEINSDDDDLEFETTINCAGHTAVKSPKPNYCSPKKTHLNFREYSKTG